MKIFLKLKVFNKKIPQPQILKRLVKLTEDCKKLYVIKKENINSKMVDTKTYGMINEMSILNKNMEIIFNF